MKPVVVGGGGGVGSSVAFNVLLGPCAAGVAVTVPVRLGAEGASTVLEWPPDAAERKALHASAATVRLAVDTVSA